MRLRSKVDNNQAAVVKALRDVGATVEHLHAVGKGCPDILVGYRGHNYLLEIKDGAKAPSARRLTNDQVDWHLTWRGTVYVVNSIEQALMRIGAWTNDR